MAIRIDQHHKHFYRLHSVSQRRGKAKKYSFKCEICKELYGTTQRRLWYPTKTVPVTERTLDYLVANTTFTREDLIGFISDPNVTRVIVNMERQLDGTWINKAVEEV